MTTWTNISNAAVAVGGIPSSTTVTALRDNPSAIAESASGAPVVFAGWHPHDKVTVGDGKAGLIYDATVNGTVSSVVTPDFQDGYEYRIVAHNLSHSDSLSSRRVEIDGYLETSAVYALLVQSADADNLASFGFDCELPFARVASRGHIVRITTYAGTTFRNGTDQSTTAYSSTSQKLLRARVSFSSGSIDAGRIWLFRRREYASAP